MVVIQNASSRELIRFNRRQNNKPGELFHKLMEYAVSVPYANHQEVVFSKD